MNLWSISIQNIKIKPLSTILGVLTLSLSIALLLGIQQIKNSIQYQIENNIGDIDAVVGAKGSPLQLVLSSVLHVDNPTGNIPYTEFLKIKNKPIMDKVVPVSYGDNYKGYRIVGTTSDFLSFYGTDIRDGRPVQKSLEVVLGHAVAKQLKLKVGDTFLSSHGLITNDIEIHSDTHTVVGILTPTNKVIDRLIITNLQSIWNVHEHQHQHYHSNDYKGNKSHGSHNHSSEHENDKEITALLISFKTPASFLTFPRKINQETNLQAALPKFELDRLYRFAGIGLTGVSWIAYFILIIAGMTIFISLYKMVKDRAFDLALLRAYGASNVQLIKIVAYEALIIVGIAFVFGWVLSQMGLGLLFGFLPNAEQGLILQNIQISQIWSMLLGVFVTIFLAILLSVRSILKMNVSNILSRER